MRFLQKLKSFQPLTFCTPTSERPCLAIMVFLTMTERSFRRVFLSKVAVFQYQYTSLERLVRVDSSCRRYQNLFELGFEGGIWGHPSVNLRGESSQQRIMY
jgi:hypothetical protein